MDVSLKYTYLIITLISFIPWLVLYLHRKDLHREMITMSILVAFMGLISNYFWWTEDWWRPLNITSTRIGIEDVMLGFSNGGIAAVLYEEIFKKRLYRYKGANHKLGALLLILILFSITAYFFHLQKLSSFVAGSIATIIAAGILIVQRRDLFYDALLTGVCLAIATIPGFLILELISPDFIEKTWLWGNLSGIRIAAVPLEDLVFYFLSGLFIAPFYLYWKGEKLRKISK